VLGISIPVHGHAEHNTRQPRGEAWLSSIRSENLRSVRSCTLLYMLRMSVSEARATLPEVLDRVAAGDEVTITRHGQPVAVLGRPDALRTRRAEPTIRQARQVAELLSAATGQPLSPAGVSTARADELVQAARQARDRH
ncbi:MAG: type II toxin-antitoxin system Phd/YefM family antitoxin, partial [Actinobacteria bacterium]|nr:type II toxin-antitoxin system Phd/YefM family antitoxin [Actinomycetota bacterium]